MGVIVNRTGAEKQHPAKGVGVARQVEKHATVPAKQSGAAVEFRRDAFSCGVDDDVEPILLDPQLDRGGIIGSNSALKAPTVMLFELFGQIASDESARAGDQDLHIVSMSGRAFSSPPPSADWYHHKQPARYAGTIIG
jgi:hypothetical protein